VWDYTNIYVSLDSTGDKASTFRALANGAWAYNRLAACDITIDDVSVKPLTFSTLLSGGGYLPRRTGIRCQIKPTITADQCGMVLLSNPTQTYRLEAIYDLNDAKGKLIKIEDGAANFTELVSASAVYAALAPIDVVITGQESAATVKLYYNSVQLGTDQTIDLRPYGTMYHGFSTSADNTPGRFQAWPA
jgi:hypothetical protein